MLKMSFRDAVPIVVPEGTFMIEERKTGTLSRLMSRLLIKSGGLTRFVPAVPVSLPDSFQRALPKFENQDASDSDDLRQWLQQLPTRLQFHGVLPDSEQGVTAAATLFTGNLLAWWQEKVARAAPDKKETAGYDSLSTLAADILGAFVTTDRLGDAFNAMNNLFQGRQTLSAYHLKVNKALREYADAFGHTYDGEQALFQYWHGLTNKHFVGILRQYYSTTTPKPSLEDIMRHALEVASCLAPVDYHAGYSGQGPKPKRRRDGDQGEGGAGTSSTRPRAGYGSTYSGKRTGGSGTWGNSKKENKSPAKRFGKSVVSKGDENGGGGQGKGPGAMSSEDVRLAAEKQGVTVDQYLEFNRVKAARGSAECRRLRNNKLCFNCGKAGHSYWDCTSPLYQSKKSSSSKGKRTCPKKGK